MERMRKNGAMRAVAVAACGALAIPLAACGSSGHSRAAVAGDQADRVPPRTTDLRRIPGIGDRLWKRVPSGTRQVVAVYGSGKDSPDSTVTLFTRHGSTWKAEQSWAAHNGRKGWTTDHREGDKRSPVGVFTLSDAGGVLDPPATKMPYTKSGSFQAPHTWGKSYWHDFDYVIAIDYNRVKGTPPDNPVRPQGESKGGSIWLHLDHGSGTSACVSLPGPAMEYLIQTLDPAQHPVVVMGDKAELTS